MSNSNIDFKKIPLKELNNKLCLSSYDELKIIINNPDFNKEYLNLFDYYGRTILYKCFFSYNNNVKRAKLLLENGANPFLGTFKGDLPYIQFLNKNSDIILKDKDRVSDEYYVLKLFAQLGGIPIIQFLNKNNHKILDDENTVLELFTQLFRIPPNFISKKIILKMISKKNWFFTPIDKSDEVIDVLIKNNFNPTDLIQFINFEDEFSNEIKEVVDNKNLVNSIRCILKDTLGLKNKKNIKNNIDSLIELSKIECDGFWCLYNYLDYGLNSFRPELIKRSKLFGLDFNHKDGQPEDSQP